MKAYLYARFSPRPHAQECDSAERQMVDLRAWCVERGLEIGGEFRDEAVSGAVAERPALYDAIALCEKGDVILVRDWSRLSRDRTKAGILLDGLKKLGVSVRSITEAGDMPDTTESRLVRNLLLDLAEYQREIIAAKTRAAMIRHQKNGRYVGGRAPYGYRARTYHKENGKFVRSLEANHQEQKIAQLIRSLRAEGMKYNQIATKLNRDKVPCRGRRWYDYTVSRIINRDESLLPGGEKWLI